MLSDYEIGYALSADTGTGGPGPDLLNVLKQDPFVPDDKMDWIMGGVFVATPYIVLIASGNTAAIAQYSAVAPDTFLFAAGVITSNIIQAPGGRYSTHSSPVYSGFQMI